jgi:hypothetical protein
MTAPKPGAGVDGKRPSDYITEAREDIAQKLLATPSFSLLSGLGQAHASVTAIGWYLDEESERRSAFERDVLARLEKLEALNPGVHTIVGVTTSGATVHGLRKQKEPSE